MAKELTQIMRSDNAENANSCKSESGVSFLDHVISPLYATIENVNMKFCLCSLLHSKQKDIWYFAQGFYFICPGSKKQ